MQDNPEGEKNLDNEINGVNYLPGIEPTLGGLDGGIELVKQFGIVAGYKKWIGKSEPKGGRTESIMVSCPLPGHPDKVPSAWLNSEKGLWHCGACGVGGDIIDLAAIAHGAPFPSYRQTSEFARVLEAALVDTGHDPDVLRFENATRSSTTPAPEEEPPPAPKAPPAEDDPDYEDYQNDLLAQLQGAVFDYESVVASAPGSFLDMWMDAVKDTDLPNEYLFWLGLQMVGLAVGRDCTLGEGTEVFPNLLMVLLGPTGVGKSRSIRLAGKVLYEALPFDHTDPSCKGVSRLPKPGSGEALYELFAWVPENETEPHPLRGMLEFDELKEIMSSAGRNGSTLREAIINLADSPESIKHRTRGAGAIDVREPFMAMTAGGQPDAIGDILDGNDMASGFANRFIYIPATVKPRRGWHDRHVPDLTGLADTLATIRAWASNHKASHHGGVIEMDMMAAQDFDEMCSWFDEMRQRPDGDLYARLELNTMKLILILCANQKVDLADQVTVKHALNLIQSTLPATDKVSEALNQSRAEYYRNAVIRAIERARAEGKRPPTQGDINRTLNQRKRNPFAIGMAIRELERAGVIRPTAFLVPTGPGQPNRTVDRWHFKDQENWWGTSNDD